MMRNGLPRPGCIARTLGTETEDPETGKVTRKLAHGTYECKPVREVYAYWYPSRDRYRPVLETRKF